MKSFTIENGTITQGVVVTKLSLKNAGFDIPAIIVGEEGRGRSIGAVPVQLSKENYELWKQEGEVVVQNFDSSCTRAGYPKLVETIDMGDPNYIVVVLKTMIGYRGSNEHTGDMKNGKYLPFPGIMLSEGIIAQGDAGRMGSGTQLVCMIPKDFVFRTAYTGRLYGQPSQHYYKYNNHSLISLTKEERMIVDVF